MEEGKTGRKLSRRRGSRSRRFLPPQTPPSALRLCRLAALPCRRRDTRIGKGGSGQTERDRASSRSVCATGSDGDIVHQVRTVAACSALFAIQRFVMVMQHFMRRFGEVSEGPACAWSCFTCGSGIVVRSLQQPDSSKVVSKTTDAGAHLGNGPNRDGVLVFCCAFGNRHHAGPVTIPSHVHRPASPCCRPITYPVDPGSAKAFPHREREQAARPPPSSLCSLALPSSLTHTLPPLTCSATSPGC